PGMSAHAAIEIEEQKEVLAIPLQAMVRRSLKDYLDEGSSKRATGPTGASARGRGGAAPVPADLEGKDPDREQVAVVVVGAGGRGGRGNRGGPAPPRGGRWPEGPGRTIGRRAPRGAPGARRARGGGAGGGRRPCPPISRGRTPIASRWRSSSSRRGVVRSW